MKKIMVLIILLLAGLYIGQLLMDDPAGNKSAQNIIQTKGKAINKNKAVAVKTSRKRQSRTVVSPREEAFILPTDNHETVGEYNFKQTRESGFVENWDVTDDQAQASSVSQARIESVRKRELAIQRRDYFLQRRNELVSE